MYCPARDVHSTSSFGGGAGTSLSGEASSSWGRSTFRRAASTVANAAPMASRATSLCGSSHALWLLRALSPWLAPAPSQVTVSRRRCPGGTAVTAVSIPWEVVGAGARPGLPMPGIAASAPVVLLQ